MATAKGPRQRGTARRHAPPAAGGSLEWNVRYHALACDYDGTLAHDGSVGRDERAALRRLRESGRRAILLTGRILEDWLRVFDEPRLFDLVVAENGAVLHNPATRETRALAAAPPEDFTTALERRGVSPVGRGRVIVATWRPHESAVLSAIRDAGLELQVIFNRGAVMVLPSGVNKATGLSAALTQLGLSPHNVVGIGDAENDHAFLTACECSVAVANALPTLKARVDWVTAADHGGGVIELADRLLASDLRELEERLSRHEVAVGEREDGRPVCVPAYGANVLVAGTSGSGKSSFTAAFLEGLAEAGYQFCIVDPEGDYEAFAGAVVLGDSDHAPGRDEVLTLLERPEANAVVNLLGVAIGDRPAFFEGLLSQLQKMRARSGRPHWIVLDETHHLLPAAWDPRATVPQGLQNMLMITVHPDRVSPSVLASVQTVVAIGDAPDATLRAFGGVLREAPAALPGGRPSPGEAVAWVRHGGEPPFWFRSVAPRTEHRRHVRKYAAGELGPDKSFYFRGPGEKLQLRAQNLQLFLQLAEGVDDETWLYHLRRGDYSRWFQEAIKDSSLAALARGVEDEPALSAQESRSRIKRAVEERYTAPE